MFETVELYDNFFTQWQKVMYSGTVGEFDENWNSLKICFGETSNPIKYLQDTWICHRKFFISCWVNQFLHLGSHVTSRVEGAHIALKNYLDNSLGDLLVVKERITLAISTQLHQIREKIATERVRVPIHLDQDFFSNVVRKISLFALLKIKKEFDKSRESVLEECTGYYRNVFGLPCAHFIRRMSRPLYLEDIHSQWHLDRPVILPLLPVARFAEVRNPIVLQGRGRPQGASNSTRRDPSGFELQEQARSGRRCGICGIRGSGHNARSCPMRRDPV
jgi:hypothetical protein